VLEFNEPIQTEAVISYSKFVILGNEDLDKSYYLQSPNNINLDYPLITSYFPDFESQQVDKVEPKQNQD
jgi:hypothetical protein